MANPVLTNGVASPQSVYEVSNYAHHRVGQRAILDDRVFYYALHVQATAVGPNTLAAAASPGAGITTETGAITSVPTGTAPAPAGTTMVTIANGATICGENEFKEGYWKIESSTLGPGQFNKIKTSPYLPASSTTGLPTFEFYDPIQTTPTGTVTWSLVHNPWSYIIQSPVTTIVSMSVGVPMVNVPVPATASVATTGYLRTAASTWSQPNYVWLQTWGAASVLMDTSAVVAGSQVVTSAVAASVGVGTGLLQVVGNALEAMTTDTVYLSTYLTIAP